MEFLAEFHPKLVHFPIALLLTYILIEAIGVLFKKDFFSKAAHLLLLLGAIGGIAAVITGNQAHDVASKWEEMGAMIPFGAINEHAEWANITLWYFAGLLVVRTVLVIKKKFTGIFKYIILVLALIGGYCVYETGEHGGELVYKHGIGTELKQAEIEE